MYCRRRYFAPLCILVVVILLAAGSATGWLPSGERALVAVEQLLQQYGLPVVALLSFIENLAGFSVYFPGSIVILATMAATAGNPTLAVQTFLAIYGGAMLSYGINYSWGRWWSMPTKGNEEPEIEAQIPSWLRKGSVILRAFSFAHPHFAAMTCLQLGLERASPLRWLAYVGIWGGVWNLFWGLLMYHYGAIIRSGGSERGWLILIVIYLLIWFGYEWFRDRRRIRKDFFSR